MGLPAKEKLKKFRSGAHELHSQSADSCQRLDHTATAVTDRSSSSLARNDANAWGLLLPNSLLNINFQDAKSLFMPLNRCLQGVKHPLGRIKICHDAILHDNGIGGQSNRLRIQAEIDDQLFRRAGHAAEIRIRRVDIGIVKANGDLLRGLLLWSVIVGFGAGGGLVLNLIDMGILLYSRGIKMLKPKRFSTFFMCITGGILAKRVKSRNSIFLGRFSNNFSSFLPSTRPP